MIIRRRLDILFKKFKMFKYIDIPLLIATVLLFSIGLVMIFSASDISAFMRYKLNPYHYVVKDIEFLLFGAFVFMILMFFKVESICKLSYFGFGVSILLLILLLFTAPVINGARSWGAIGNKTFQPSEIAKAMIVIYMPSVIFLKKKKINNIWFNVIYILSLIACTGLVFLQGDFGTGIIMVLLTGLIYLLLPIERNIKFKIVGSMVILALIAFLSFKAFLPDMYNEKMKRFNTDGFCSADRFYTDGNQMCNSYIAFNNGSWFGKGIGNSTQKYLYLPDSHTDFIFAIVVEELGFVGGMVIIGIIFFVVLRIFVIGKNSKEAHYKYICYGAAIYIFLHFAINLSGITGLLPMTGIPLPFISYGGSYTTCLIAVLSVVQRIAAENKCPKIY